MRVGLVLGAGGVQGGAWLTGALAALAEETGWDPASADYIVGTSAGSMLGSLLAAGLPPWFMVAHSAGETFEGMTDARGERGRRRRPLGGRDLQARARSAADLPRLAAARPAQPAPARTGTPPASVISGWAPRGMISSEPLREIIRSAVPGEWTKHPNHWVVACDYATGRRVSFGRRGAPQARLEDAVAASCSIPGFYRPVRIGDRLLRRRRHLVHLEPRRPPRPGARPRHLPQPDLQPPPGPRAQPGQRRSACSSTGPAAGGSARRRSGSAPRAPRSS